MHVPPTRRVTVGDRALAVSAAPRVWNRLPSDVITSPSLIAFKRRLKTLLFSSSVASHRQPRGPRGAQGPNTVKGAQSDPNYVTRLGLGPVANVCRGPENYSYAIALQPLL